MNEELTSIIPQAWRAALRADTRAHEIEQEIWWTNGKGDYVRYWTERAEQRGATTVTRMQQTWRQEEDSQLLRAMGQPQTAVTERHANKENHECVVKAVHTVDAHKASWDQMGAKELRKARQQELAYEVQADHADHLPIALADVTLLASGLLAACSSDS